MVNTDMSGKVALVTGGSRGLGLAVVGELRRRGAHVVALARDAARLADAVAPLGDGVLGLQGDIANPDDVRRVFREIERHFGRLDFLVNNAAVAQPYAVDQLPDEEIASEIGVNFAGAVYTVRAAVPLMRVAGAGVIVNVSSESTQEPLIGMALYAATKAALESFTLALNGELRDDRIVATLLRVGRMKDTGFSKSWAPGQKERAVQSWSHDERWSKAGGPTETACVAEVLVGALALPPAAQLRLIDLREYGAR